MRWSSACWFGGVLKMWRIAARAHCAILAHGLTQASSAAYAERATGRVHWHGGACGDYAVHALARGLRGRPPRTAQTRQAPCDDG